jgi:protocatechuate 3,4-dioxygenase beta subunit
VAYEDDRHDRGLAFDLETLLGRRRALKLLAGAGFLTLVGCGSGSRTHESASTSSSTATTSGPGASTTATTTAAGSAGSTGSAADCSNAIPEETGGPFPADGTNGPNVLRQSGIVRSDIRSSFTASTGTAEGVPLTINLTILNKNKNCAALNNAAVYVWQCNRDGLYSLYGKGVTDQNYLRGVQTTDKNGRVTFQSIFPACYSGRWPHIHLEVYPNLSKATSASGKIATSQIALPEDACRTVFATEGYRSSLGNLSRVTLATDNVFGDGSSHQLGTVAGSVAKGFTVELTVPVNT